jgi:hypothetical protein
MTLDFTTAICTCCELEQPDVDPFVGLCVECVFALEFLGLTRPKARDYARAQRASEIAGGKPPSKIAPDPDPNDPNLPRWPYDDKITEDNGYDTDDDCEDCPPFDDD